MRENAIAIEVFRRNPATYDPQTDPIVRVTTGRLRARLAAHYATVTEVPAVRIVLPKGVDELPLVGHGSARAKRHLQLFAKNEGSRTPRW